MKSNSAILKRKSDNAIRGGGFTPDFCENTILSPKFIGGLNQNSAYKISARFSYLVILNISCKNIEKWRSSRKKFKVHFRKIDFGDFWRFLLH